MISSEDSPLVSARQIFKFRWKSSSLPCCLKILALQNLSSLMGRFSMMSMRRWLLCSIITCNKIIQVPYWIALISLPNPSYVIIIKYYVIFKINCWNNWANELTWPALLHSRHLGSCWSVRWKDGKENPWFYLSHFSVKSCCIFSGRPVRAYD